jgi:hypothetical protein
MIGFDERRVAGTGRHRNLEAIRHRLRAAFLAVFALCRRPILGGGQI